MGLRLGRTIYGRGNTPYRTDFSIGSIRLHIFHRGDEDPDPHDHPFDFWTFPLTTYLEKEYDPDGEIAPRLNVVKAFRLHRRAAEYRHRVLNRLDRKGNIHPGRIITIFGHGKEYREWGFWVPDPRRRGLKLLFRPWKDYIEKGRYGGEYSRIDVV